MRALPAPLRSFLPLAGLLVLAATNACVIINGDGDDNDDEQCVDLTEVCPNLVCDAGNVVVDGCPICECTTACDPGPAPECAFPVLIEQECRWECGTAGCAFDEECGPGFFCDLSGANATPPNDGDAAPEPQPDPIPPPRQGQCRPLPTDCVSDRDCREGQVCEFPDASNGLVAPAGVCVFPTPVSECEVDTDCAGGQICAIECRSDPNCPACDVCLFVGTCITPEQPCFSDAECVAGEFCDFSGAPRRPCPDVDGDGLCDENVDPLPAPGICRPLEEPNPCAAVLCVVGTTCVVENGEAVCVPGEPLCASDNECGEGLVCNAAEICLPPPNCTPEEPCPAICYGFCVERVLTCFSDAECIEGEVCVFDGAIGGGSRPIIAPQGTCQPAPTPCNTDEACARGEVCLNGACVEDPNANPCATVRCSAGTTCQVNAAGNAECVPDATVCSNDADCENGGSCNAGIDVCNPPPDCQPGDVCADVCFGFCR